MEDLTDEPMAARGPIQEGPAGMCCPLCRARTEQGVKDTRPTVLPDGTPSVRRRRLCGACGRRYTTYEVLEGHLIDGAEELRKSLVALERTVDLLKAIIRGK